MGAHLGGCVQVLTQYISVFYIVGPVLIISRPIVEGFIYIMAGFYL